MRVLIIGSGGREHALSWKVARSGKAEKIYCAPGNGGTAQEGENIPLKDSDVAGLVSFAKGNVIDFVIPGPELPLTLGVVDAMTQAGIRCFGPSQWCAQLEGSKAFAKDIMQKAGVPTAACGVFTELEAAKSFVEEKGAPIVIKADGLAAGKGVVVAQTKEEALEALDQIMGGVFGAGRKPCGHRRISGGRGSVAAGVLRRENGPPAAFRAGPQGRFRRRHPAPIPGVWAPTARPRLCPMRSSKRWPTSPSARSSPKWPGRGIPFTGILYAGLMMTKDGPKVLEYNVRFGDPECEPLLMRLESDLLEIMDACIDGRLDEVKLSIRPESALGVVIAAEGYPGSYPKGMEIKGIDAVDALPDTKVFQAGTKREGSRTLSSGGRVLCVTALGKGLAEAQKRAYEAVAKIDMEKSQHRSDIGAKGLRRL